MPTPRKPWTRAWPVAVLTILAAILLAKGGSAPSNAAPSTWSIVAWDRASGQMGVAAASCWPGSIVTIAAIVPGLGVGVAQGLHEADNRLQLHNAIAAGKLADEVIDQLSDSDSDPAAESRQYAAITLSDDSAEAVAFTGSSNPDWAGHIVADDRSFAVQGNTLQTEQVATDTARAYASGVEQGLPLPDRLMMALEAGSVAGGDRRCNTEFAQQTAASAFIAVIRPEDVAIGGGQADPDAPAPWLLLSVVEPIGGPNPLIALRARYNLWRADHLPLCSDCASEEEGSLLREEDAGGSTPDSGGRPASANAGSGTALSLGTVVLGLTAIALFLAIWRFSGRRSN